VESLPPRRVDRLLHHGAERPVLPLEALLVDVGELLEALLEECVRAVRGGEASLGRLEYRTE